MTVPPPDLSSLSWDFTHRQVAHGLADELRSTLFSQEEGTCLLYTSDAADD